MFDNPLDELPGNGLLRTAQNRFIHHHNVPASLIGRR